MFFSPFLVSTMGPRAASLAVLPDTRHPAAGARAWWRHMRPWTREQSAAVRGLPVADVTAAERISLKSWGVGTCFGFFN